MLPVEESPYRVRYNADVADRAARMRSLLTREAKRDERYLELSLEERELLQNLRVLASRMDEIKNQMGLCRRIDSAVVARYAAYIRLGYEPPMPKPVDRHSELHAEYKRVRAEHKAMKTKCGHVRILEKYIDYCRRIESDRRKLEADAEILRIMREILWQQECVAAIRNDTDWMKVPEP